MTMTDTPRRRGCPRWLKLLLILSLAVNVAIAGIVIGHSARGGEGGENRRARSSDRVINWIVDMLPEERRDLAVAHFAAARERLDAARVNRSKGLAAVVASMRAEPYDPDATLATLNEMFDSRTNGRAAVRERLATLLAELTPAERAAFADRFAERLDDRRKQN